MRTRALAWLPVPLVALAVSGCVTLKRTPEARFFVLRSVVEPAPAAAELLPGAVGVRPLRLPGHLQRPQLVTAAGPNELRIDEFARWAEPIGPAATRVLAENLAALLVERRVLQSPWPADVDLLCRVVVEVDSFAPQQDGEVRLVGRWALLGPAGVRSLARREFSLRRGSLPVGASGVEPTAATAAMSELLGELAAEIAAAVRELPATPAGAEP